VSEFSKYRLLRHAEFLVYPSLYEGFGIPALAAMSLGKPILAARTSSFPELIGDAGIFFDPISVTEFCGAFADIADDGALAQLGPRAFAQSKLYNVQKMAGPILDWITASTR